MPNYTFLARFRLQIWSVCAPKFQLNIHLTKSPKRDHNIIINCLYTLEEHNCLILTSYHVPKLKYCTRAQK